MATITSVGSGAWGTVGTWDVRVPLDGDDVVIASGHTVVFDVDQSAFTTGVKITITGTLTHATTGGPYTLFIKTGASVVGTGTWNVGTSGTPIPFAVKHTITGAAGWYISGTAGMVLNVYAAEPTTKYVKLSGAEAAGQTELSIDTNVTGDIWAAGDLVAICQTKAKSVEERTIAAGGISADHIDVTAGLTNAKNAGAYIFLLTRNVKFVFTGTPSNCVTGAFTINSAGGFWHCATGKYLFNGQTVNVSGGIYYNGYIFYNAIVDVTNGMFVNGDWLDRSSHGILSGGVIAGFNEVLRGYTNYAGGLIACNANPLNGIMQSGAIENVTFDNNGIAVFGVPGLNIRNVIFSNNTYNIRNCSGIAFDCTFSSTEFFMDTSASYFDYWNMQLENIGGVAGALKAYSKGGIISSQTTVLPTGYSLAYLHTLSSASFYCFWTKHIFVPVGATLSVEVQLRKSASMTYLPRVYLVEGNDNPLLETSEVVDSFTMTDSTDTWESHTFTITNSTSVDKDLTLYFVAKNATGEAYSAVNVTAAGGGGGRNVVIPIFLKGRHGKR